MFDLLAGKRPRTPFNGESVTRIGSRSKHTICASLAAALLLPAWSTAIQANPATKVRCMRTMNQSPFQPT